MRGAELKKRILSCGEALGFRNPGVARLAPLDRDAYFNDWLADGRAGDMRFLEHHKKARLDPHSRFPWARSVLSASYPYAPPARSAPAPWRKEMRGRIAAYAVQSAAAKPIEALSDAFERTARLSTLKSILRRNANKVSATTNGALMNALQNVARKRMMTKPKNEDF